jgi:hypothetical protein
VSDRVFLGIDPGPKTSGLVVYKLPLVGPGCVLASNPKATMLEVRAHIDHHAKMGDVIVCECTQAGPPSTQVVRTTEVVGRIMERCAFREVELHLYYRREVLQALACARKGNKDSLVRLALIELHGGDRASAIGRKKSPGPLYGLSSHAWQAMGVVAAHTLPWTPNNKRTH